MVKHIVLWTIKEGLDKAQVFSDMQQIFDGFKNDVPGMTSLALHRGYQGFDVCLISEHESRDALDAYQQHPAHLEAKKAVEAVRSDRASCDFEV